MILRFFLKFGRKDDKSHIVCSEMHFENADSTLGITKIIISNYSPFQPHTPLAPVSYKDSSGGLIPLLRYVR